eukprot:363452-Chlamydomonas_euryale.AAC.7
MKGARIAKCVATLYTFGSIVQSPASSPPGAVATPKDTMCSVLHNPWCGVRRGQCACMRAWRVVQNFLGQYLSGALKQVVATRNRRHNISGAQASRMRTDTGKTTSDPQACHGEPPTLWHLRCDDILDVVTT